MGTRPPTRSTQRYSSSPSDRDPEDVEGIMDDFFDMIDCDDFWWDEEDRHELF